MLLSSVPDFDAFEPTSDTAPSPLTRDFIGLCIGILSVVLVILTVAICKWSRFRCLNPNRHDYDQTESLTSVVDHNTAAPAAAAVARPSRQRHRNPTEHRSSSCDRQGNVRSNNNNRTRDGLLSSPQPTYSGYPPAPRDLKVPRVTITALSVQPSQQMVPRLSVSPQVSNSSTTQSTYSIKQ